MNKKTRISSIIMIFVTVFLFVIIYGVITLGPATIKTIKVSNMSDAEVLEYVLPMIETDPESREYIDFLESISRKQATRVLDIVLAYNINRLSQTDAFTF